MLVIAFVKRCFPIRANSVARCLVLDFEVPQHCRAVPAHAFFDQFSSCATLILRFFAALRVHERQFRSCQALQSSLHLFEFFLEVSCGAFEIPLSDGVDKVVLLLRRDSILGSCHEVSAGASMGVQPSANTFKSLVNLSPLLVAGRVLHLLQLRLEVFALELNGYSREHKAERSKDETRRCHRVTKLADFVHLVPLDSMGDDDSPRDCADERGTQESENDSEKPPVPVFRFHKSLSLLAMVSRRFYLTQPEGKPGQRLPACHTLLYGVNE